MSLNLTLSTLSMPDGQEFPGTPQGLADLLVQYIEIAGQAGFNGVVYGTTTPASGDRDKLWVKVNGSNVFLGLYFWDGSAWSLAPLLCKTGTTAQRNALSNIQEGTQYYTTGSGLYIYTSNTWQRCIPEQTLELGDKHYFFDTHQSLASVSSVTGGWIQVDVTSKITAAGLTGKTVKAAIVRLETQIGPLSFGGPLTADATLKVSRNNSVSTSATDVPTCYSIASRDDSIAAAANQYETVLNMASSTSIYYSLTNTGATTGLAARVWLVGFIYQ